jgi:hypothetical protein
MKYFKDSSNNVFAYEADGSQDQHISANLISITEVEADALRAEQTQALFNEQSYVQKRASEYPDFRDYLDGIVKGDQTQIQAYISACQAVKDKYPKV